MDRQLKSMGNDSLDKLLFASDNITKDLGKEILKNLVSLGMAEEEIFESMTRLLTLNILGESIFLIEIRDSPRLQPSSNSVLTLFNMPVILESFLSLLQ